MPAPDPEPPLPPPEHPNGAGDHASGPPDVEAVLAACLDRDEHEWGPAVEQACREHPAAADTLLRRFRMIAPAPAVGSASLASGTAGRATDAGDAPRRLGDFELGPVLGAGGMGVVHLARDVRLGRDVAIKLLRPELLWFEGSRERFEREGVAVARLQHPGIVPVLSCGEVDGVPYYAMQRVDGIALDQLLAALRQEAPETLNGEDVARVLAERCGALDDEVRARLRGTWPELCTRFVSQAADAVAHAHSRGVLHRDLKPSNIMLRTDGRIQLLDFGLAAVTGASRLTASQGVIGSPPYMTPEQLWDGATNERSDVYGLGVTAYELLTLHCPFLRESGEATRRAILDGSHDPIRQRLPGVSWDLATVVEVAMDPEPDRRYRSAAAMRDDLDRVAAGDAITARRPGRLRRSLRWIARHPAPTTALLLGFVLAVSIPTILFVNERTQLQQQQQALARETELLATTKAALAAERAALDEFTQLADQLRVQELVDGERLLWPPVPANLSGLNEWVTNAGELLDRRALHRAATEALEAQALPYTDEMRSFDEQRAQPFVQRAEALRRQLAQPMDTTWGSNQKLQEQWRRQLDEATRAAERRSWRFESVRQQWLHDELLVLLEQLDRLEALVPRVTERLELARDAHARTIDEPRARWLVAMAQIAADARFRGYELQPTVGLVPLGADPTSGLQEFAIWHSGEVPSRAADGTLELGEHVAVVVVLVPGGSFTIGARPPAYEGETGANIDPLADGSENPLQTIELDPYLIGKYEVHQGQWQRIMERNPSATLPGDGVGPDGRYTADRPVDNVSWTEASEFARRLGGDLPTEAQWERAARAGTTTPWWAGDDPTTFAQVGNICDASVTRAGIELRFLEPDYDDGYVQAAPVGSFRANPFGLHDTIGNLDEWCRDALCAYSDAAAPGDGLFTMGFPETRVTRGGNFGSVFASVRSSKRGSASLDHRGNALGVRVVLPAPVAAAGQAGGSVVEQGGEPGERTGK